MKRNTVQYLAALSLVFSLSACVTSNPQTAHTVAQPKTTPMRNITSFTPALQCMDDMFHSFGVRDVVVTSDGIPDETGEVGAGTKDMLISAISRMSVKSKAFTFVDFDQSQDDVAELQALIGYTDEFRVPSYYIRGAITQLDSGVIAEQVGGGVAVPDFSLGVSKDLVVSVVSVDMNMAHLATRQILPGIAANNSIAVSRTGVGGDANATIGKAGLFFNVSMNNSEGVHAATRTLIELSAIEIMGKLTEVPYWRCLQIEQTNPEMIAVARSWFESMSSQDRIVFVQRALASEGYYYGPISGTLDTSTKGAVSRYQAENGLLANGDIDLQLYRSLIAQDLALGYRPKLAEPATVDVTAPPPLGLELVTEKGAAPEYRVEEVLRLAVTTSQDSYVYCYYRDDRGQIARIFPNSFQPDPYAIGGKTLQIPSQDALFDIVFERPGVQEEVVCLASYKEVGTKLPEAYKVADLTPLPVDSMSQLVSSFSRIDPTHLARARVTIRVAD